MSELLRVKARWTGFTGAPGYSVLHFRDFSGGEPSGSSLTAAQALAAAGRVRTFFEAIKGNLPVGVFINVDPEVEVLDIATGTLLRSFTVATPATVAGTAANSYSAAVGAVVNWRTDGIRNGRRVRGRTFLVPLQGNAFATTGQLGGPVVTALTTAAQALADSTQSPDLFVYGRPTGPGANDGVAYVVTNANVPPMGAILTSRRD